MLLHSQLGPPATYPTFLSRNRKAISRTLTQHGAFKFSE
ncbi:hypothetical protein NY78_4460 [Desulfovibrio sp. TomC]|nr:hypothetical protein NY78_4460 [Desulfovibrio sp. TomC]